MQIDPFLFVFFFFLDREELKKQNIKINPSVICDYTIYIISYGLK